jgi:hypothetical protein
MDFEVKHNEVNLPAAAMIEVYNVKTYLKWYRKFMDKKRPRGLKIRSIEDNLTKKITLSARASEPLRYFVNGARKAGLVKKVYMGRRNLALWKGF